MKKFNDITFTLGNIVCTCKDYKGGYKPANVGFLKHNKELARKYYGTPIDNKTVLRKHPRSAN